MRSKLIAGIVLALVVPSVALAAKPPSPGKSQSAPNSAPKVMYVLKGDLSNYVAANGATNGSITIVVKSANYHGKALKNQSLTIAVSSSTKVQLFNGATSLGANEHGIVKVRAAKGLTGAALVTALTTPPTVAFQVIDQGPNS